MKKFMMIVCVLLLILFVLISCAPDPAVLFENFMDDLDIEGRFSENAVVIERGKSTDFTIRAIDALIADFKSMTLDNAEAKRIIASFTQSCEMLRESALASSNDVKETLIKAQETFQAALKDAYAFTKQR